MRIMILILRLIIMLISTSPLTTTIKAMFLMIANAITFKIAIE